MGASIFFVIFIQSVNLRFCISDRLTKSFPGAEQCTPAVVPKKPVPIHRHRAKKREEGRMINDLVLLPLTYAVKK